MVVPFPVRGRRRSAHGQKGTRHPGSDTSRDVRSYRAYGGLSRAGRGQRDRERGALTEGAGDLERASVRVDDRLGDRQAEADAGDGPPGGRRRPEEAVGEVGQLVGRDARPLSATTRTAPPRAPGLTPRRTVPPDGVNLIALDTRLSTAWASRTGSAWTPPTSRRARGRSPPPSAAGAAEAAAAATISAASTRCGAMENRPASTCAVSSRSPTRRSWRRGVALDHGEVLALLVGQRSVPSVRSSR